MALGWWTETLRRLPSALARHFVWNIKIPDVNLSVSDSQTAQGIPPHRALKGFLLTILMSGLSYSRGIEFLGDGMQRRKILA